MSRSQPPRVFLSHTSSDKERFVRSLASLLVGDGVDVVYDEWSFDVGDTLRQEIDKGIKGSDLLVLIISKDALESQWVSHEIEAALYKRITAGGRVFPVVLGSIPDTDLPSGVRESLQHRVMLEPDGSIDEASVRSAAKEIVRVAFQQPKARPSLGQPPSFVVNSDGVAPRVLVTTGLDLSELSALRAVGDLVMENQETFVDTPRFVERCAQDYDFGEDETLDHLEVLDSLNFVNLSRAMNPERVRRLGHFTATNKALTWYFKVFVDNSADLERAVYSAFANGADQGDLRDVCDSSGAPLLLVRLVADQLSSSITLSNSQGPSKHYFIKSRPVSYTHLTLPTILLV